jgi:hypothetical protein
LKLADHRGAVRADARDLLIDLPEIDGWTIIATP